MPVMKSLTAQALIVLVFLLATSLGSAFAPPCETGCAGDGPDGTCAPLCQDCACCPTLASGVQVDVVISSPAQVVLAPPPGRQTLPRDTDPSDIFHIPKPFLV